ncbi:MAG: long-chain fatty acid--CoA ligase, partial [Actinobacteria bacterium]|nr:long-chain fatty acid--CoA ligase [Actinomycetota bacterium]
AALPMSTFHATKERLGIELSEGYGLTETGGIVSSSSGFPIRPGSVGKPLAGVEMRIVDDDVDVPVGDRGEIWVRGDNVTGGYWDDLEATGRSVTADGWFRTGDIGVVDDDGYLYLVDRSKDMIIVSGFNVFPAEVEEVLMQHSDVAGVIVVGRPDQRTGERVVAHVKLIEGSSTTPDQLTEHCLDNLARYKSPTAIELDDDLPISLTGKRVRRLLK